MEFEYLSTLYLFKILNALLLYVGLAQCAELCWQLRGLAGPRQVPGAKLALQHNLGLGGAVVVGLYRRGFHTSAGANNKAT